MERITKAPEPKTIDEARGMARIKITTAAPLWGMSRYTLACHCLKGNVPGAQKLGRCWYVTPQGMDQMFENQGKKFCPR